MAQSHQRTATSAPAQAAVPDALLATFGRGGSNADAQDQLRAAQPAPLHEQVDDKVNGGAGPEPGLVGGDASRLVALAESGDSAGFASFVGTFSADYRTKMKGELIREHAFDSMPLDMQTQLAPDSAFHQESQVDAGGEINCTTAVRIEGATSAAALTALTQTNWADWWATSTTSGAPPSFDFIPEAPIKAIPGFHLKVNMGAPIADGDNWRLPATLVGTFSGKAEIYIESVEGGVVVHDSWMGVKLNNWTMEHAGGARFWTGGHLDALKGAMFGGMLGATGFAGLRKHLQGGKKGK